MKRSDFIFDSVQLMYYKCHKIRLICDGSYIDSLDWIKKKKATINPKNINNKCFQYAATAAWNYEEIELHTERVSSIKPFIYKHNSEGINYPSKINDWKTFEEKNLTIVLNILYTKEKEIFPAYISKINSNCEKQIIILIIPQKEKEGQHYLALKKLPTLLREIISKYHGDVYCFNYLNSFRTKINLSLMNKYVQIKVFVEL